MLSRCCHLLRDAIKRVVFTLDRRARSATPPYSGFLRGAVVDRLRSPEELAAENQLLRLQLMVVSRQPSAHPWTSLPPLGNWI